MAFDVTKGACIGQLDGKNRLWIYRTSDAPATVTADGYFGTGGLDNITLYDTIIYNQESGASTSFLTVTAKNTSGISVVFAVRV